MFFVTWYKSFVSIVSIDVWAYLSLICLLICLLGLILYLFVENDIVRRILRMALPLFFICFLVGTALAIQQSLFVNSHDRGVIMSSICSGKENRLTRILQRCLFSMRDQRLKLQMIAWGNGQR